MPDTFDDLEIPPFLRRQDLSPSKGEDTPPQHPLLTPLPEDEASVLREIWDDPPPPRPITEPTEQGNQFVIPGCEKDQSRKRGQLELF